MKRKNYLNPEPRRKWQHSAEGEYAIDIFDGSVSVRIKSISGIHSRDLPAVRAMCDAIALAAKKHIKATEWNRRSKRIQL
jgi:hypothetical protein